MWIDFKPVPEHIANPSLYDNLSSGVSAALVHARYHYAHCEAQPIEPVGAFPGYMLKGDGATLRILTADPTALSSPGHLYADYETRRNLGDTLDSPVLCPEMYIQPTNDRPAVVIDRFSPGDKTLTQVRPNLLLPKHAGSTSTLVWGIPPSEVGTDWQRAVGKGLVNDVSQAMVRWLWKDDAEHTSCNTSYSDWLAESIVRSITSVWYQTMCVPEHLNDVLRGTVLSVRNNVSEGVKLSCLGGRLVQLETWNWVILAQRLSEITLHLPVYSIRADIPETEFYQIGEHHSVKPFTEEQISRGIQLFAQTLPGGLF